MVSLSICSTFVVVSSPAFSSMPVKRKFARREYCCWSSIDNSSSCAVFFQLGDSLLLVLQLCGKVGHEGGQ